MLNIKRTGSTPGEAAAFLRSVPREIIPYATATALTRTAKLGQADEVAAMRADFDRPTDYTLNSTFIVPATKDNLQARIGIKNQAGANTTPEHFLFPEVFGGGRREKRFEAAMRLAGFMQPGERAMPGVQVVRDANGNVSAGTIRNLLRQAGKTGGKNKIFAGAAGRNRTRGIWQRDGRSLKPLFIFTAAQPQYKTRYDFQAVADKTARTRFSGEFYTAVQALLAKGRA